MYYVYRVIYTLWISVLVEENYISGYSQDNSEISNYGYLIYRLSTRFEHGLDELIHA